MLKFTRFQEVFSMLGSSILLPQEHIDTLEEFVCYLYSYKSKNIDNARFQSFNKKYVLQNKGKLLGQKRIPHLRGGGVEKIHLAEKQGRNSAEDKKKILGKKFKTDKNDNLFGK